MGRERVWRRLTLSLRPQVHYSFHSHFIDKNMVIWTHSANEAGKCSYNSITTQCQSNSQKDFFGTNCKGAKIAKSVLKKKVERVSLPNFQTYCKATTLRTGWEWRKDRPIDQCNRSERPEIDLRVYGQMIFEKVTKTIE